MKRIDPRRSPSAKLLGSVLLWVMASLAGGLLLLSCKDGVSPSLVTLSPPSGLRAEPTGPSGIRLQWQMPPGGEVVAFEIDRRVDLDGPFTFLTSVALTNLTMVGDEAQYLDSDLQAKTFYGYRLRSVGPLDKVSENSTIAGARTADPPGIKVVTRALTTSVDESGYTVKLTGPQASSSAIGADDVKVFSPLPTGTYTVTLSGLESRCSIEGGESSRTAVVSDEGLQTLTPVQFEVRCRDPNRGRIVVTSRVTGNAFPENDLALLLSGVTDGGDPVSRTASIPAARPPGSSRLFDDLLPGSYEVEIQGFDASVCSIQGANPVQDIQVGALTTDTADFQLSCRIGVDPSQANVLGRWVDGSGTPVEAVKPGTTVGLQICTRESEVEAFTSKLLYTPDLMVLDSITDFDSSADVGVHPDCQGVDDKLDDFLVPNPGGPGSGLGPGEASFQIVRVESTGSQGNVGIVTAYFRTLDEGTEFVGLEVDNFAKTGFVPVTPATNIDSLGIDPNLVTNSSPVADAGGPYTGKAGEPVSFDGTGSADPDGTVVRWDWVFGDGSSESDAGATPTHTYTDPGTYTATLTVTDDQGAEAEATAQVTVEAANQPPVADAGGPYFGEPGTAMTFDGSGSFDPENEALTYAWTFGDGSTSDQGPGTTHTYASESTYTVVLTVSDPVGNSAMDTTSAKIRAPGSVFRWKNRWVSDTAFMDSVAVLYLSARPDQPFSFAAGAVHWDDESLRFDSARAGPFADTQFEVNQPSPGRVEVGARASSPSAPDAESQLGSLFFTVLEQPGDSIQVATSTTNVILPGTDLAGLSTIEDTLLVRTDNLRPTAEANGPYMGRAGENITFTASGSKDLDGSIFFYDWSFGDGQHGVGPAPQHAYDTAGVYPVVLTVTDNRGLTAQDTASAEIAANIDPSADANGPYAATLGAVVSFTASGSVDTDGSIVDFHWDFGDGTEGSGPAPLHTYFSSGQFTAVLTVTDNNGGVGVASAPVAIAFPDAYAIRNQWINRSPQPVSPALGISGTFDGPPGYAGPGDRMELELVSRPDPGSSVAEVDFTIQWDTTVARFDSIRGGAVFDADFSAKRQASVGRLAYLDIHGLATTALDPLRSTDLASAFFTVLGLEGDSLKTRTTNVTLRNGEGAIQADTIPVLESTLRIREGGENDPPVSDAGGPYTGQVGTPVNLNGLGSSDPDGLVVQYDWSFGDGTTVIDAGPTPRHIYGEGGVYTVFLKVHDNDGGVDLDEAQVNISAAKPSADPGGPYTVTEGVPLAFDGTGSADPDGTIVRYDWDFGDGATAMDAGPSPNHTYSQAGTYTVVLTVTDNDGSTDAESTTVTVEVNGGGGNMTPSADPGGPYAVQSGAALTLDGTASTDPDGTIVRYDWNFGDGTVGIDAGPSPTHTYTQVATVTVQLTVTDDQGATNTATTTVTIQPSGGGGNNPPVADVGGPYSGDVGTDIAFDGSGSSDSDGSIVQYAWTFGDGSGGAGVSPTHAYGSAGTYTVSLTVTDDDGATGSSTAQVTVNEAGPTANVFGRWLSAAGAEITSAPAGSTVYLQICTSVVSLEAVDAQLTVDKGAIQEGFNFETDSPGSTQAGAVHSACVGTDDQLDDFFFPFVQSGASMNFGMSAVTPPSVGRAGLTEVKIDLSGASGVLTPSLSFGNFDIGAGVQGTPVMDLDALTIGG